MEWRPLRALLRDVNGTEGRDDGMPSLRRESDAMHENRLWFWWWVWLALRDCVGGAVVLCGAAVSLCGTRQRLVDPLDIGLLDEVQFFKDFTRTLWISRQFLQVSKSPQI